MIHTSTVPIRTADNALDFAVMIRESCRARIRNVRRRQRPLVERVADFLAERVGPEVGQGLTQDEIARAFPGEPVTDEVTAQAFTLVSLRAVRLLEA